MSLPPPYIPLSVVKVLAMVKHKVTGRQYHQRDFEVLIERDGDLRSIRDAWQVLHGDEWLLSGFLIRKDLT